MTDIEPEATLEALRAELGDPVYLTTEERQALLRTSRLAMEHLGADGPWLSSARKKLAEVKRD